MKSHPSEIATDVASQHVVRPLNIGARLSALRQARSWTLQQASVETGVSASAISKIERNELSPTVSTLQRLARGYSVDVTDLLNGQEGQRSLAGRRSVTRANAGRPYSSNSCDNFILCGDLLDKRMTPIRTRVTARSTSEYDFWPASDSEIFLTVLRGVMVVHSEIYAPLTLQPGDSLYYDASSPHVWTTEGDEDAEVIWVIAT
jgi:transcriptional regulator with XRE-family HTH domain